VEASIEEITCVALDIGLEQRLVLGGQIEPSAPDRERSGAA
jgi:hypothetical protein